MLDLDSFRLTTSCGVTFMRNPPFPSFPRKLKSQHRHDDAPVAPATPSSYDLYSSHDSSHAADRDSESAADSSSSANTSTNPDCSSHLDPGTSYEPSSNSDTSDSSLSLP